ncbi:MAG: hypothetical protein AB8F95_18365 [Bacteroidia bacterium]
MQVHILPHTEIDARRWDDFIKASPQGSVYATYDYATSVKPDWQALIIEENGVWQAILPFVQSKKYGLRYVLQAPFCQTWGPILAPFEAKNTYTALSQQHKRLEALSKAIPTVHLTQINCHASLQYLLPFHHEGFRAEVRYTHQLTLEPEDMLRQGLSSQTKRNLGKSHKAGHTLFTADDTELYMRLLTKNKAEGHDTMGGLKEGDVMLKKLSTLPTVSILEIHSPTGTGIAAGLFANWNGTRYYLAGAQDPESKDEGAMYRLLWEAMLEAERQGCTLFDFEGSMISGVARFFRQFGASPVPYFSLKKNRLPLLGMLQK